MIRLSVEELKTLINVVSLAQVQVAQAPILIGLVNKLSKMVDEASQSTSEPESRTQSTKEG